MAKKLPKGVSLVRESKIKQSKSNKHISYSQLTSYVTCPKQWYLTYVKNLAPYKPSIHAVFGTAMHETIQTWLDLLYNDTVKKSNELDLAALLTENMQKAYKAQKAMYSHEHFSDAKEMDSFHKDGVAILEFIKKRRVVYFTTKNTYLAGIETLLYQELRPGVCFKGLIDIVLYDKVLDKWFIIDLKTSTSGWSDYVKKDNKKIAQVLLYKEFFSKQFDIDIDKIEVVYYILKRKIPMEADFASMQRRVQEFKPASGKVKRAEAVSMMEKFVEDTLDKDGNFYDKEYTATPSEDSCRFCVFRNNPICPQGV
jgi:hypothetical protein